MKIAFVGKGGSGKSTVSWLMTSFLTTNNKNVLAIDADHNMDLTSNLNVDADEQVATVQKSHKLFLNYFGYEDNAKWSEVKINKENPPVFSLFPHNEVVKQVVTQASPNLSLINAGLGEPDVIEGGYCGHFLANPIRYFLSYVDDTNTEIIVDCVAGFDILNYGFQIGIDAFVGIVEPHKNSIKVMKQIKQNATASLVPLYIILNKPNNTEFTAEIRQKFAKELVGEIAYDEGVLSIDYTRVSDATKNSLSNVWNELNKRFNKEAQREIQKQLRKSFEF